MMNSKPALEIDDLTVAYKLRPVLWDIDLKVPEGVMMAVIGPNGAGKSTLIKACLGIVKPLAGEVKMLGEPYLKMRSKIGYVPQRGSVDWDFPTTVKDVVLMGTYGRLGWIRRPGKKQAVMARAAIDRVGLSDFADRQISQLSGGQQQRVFLARALVQNAEIYFLDEPLQGVDATSEKAIIDILKELKSKGKTLIVVHHDLQTVKRYFDWVTFLNVKVVSSGPVEKVFTTENLKETYGSALTLATSN